MKSQTLGLGDVIIVVLPEHQPPGREQQGYRPAIVAGFPDKLGKPRYPGILVVPVTTYKQQSWVEASSALYPRLKADDGNLPSDSVVLLDQLRFVDAKRVARQLGTLTPTQYLPIFTGIQHMLQA